jgi:transposase-like protein
MELNFKSLPALLKHFQNEDTCVEFLKKQRWNNKPVCPHCGSMKTPYETNRGYKCSEKECHKKFSITTGTIFENTKIKLSLWYAAIYIASAHKKGISSHQLAKDLGITQKSAWFMLMRIREGMKERNPKMLVGTTQADETFVGGKNRNRHNDKKVELSQGRSVKDKTPVFGLLNNGSVNTQVVADTKAITLKPIIKEMVEKGSIIVTDEWGAYNGINSDFQHEVVKHKESNYVSTTGFHTNGIEGYWSLFKRGIYGIYHHASPKHLQRYCNEFSYRFNTRVIKDTDRFSLSLTKINGRLTYKNLIQK